MLVARDFECETCGVVEEHIVDNYREAFMCSQCGGHAKKIISVGHVYCGNQDAPWLKSVVEVIEKGTDKAHCNEAIKNPTRANINNWMKKEGLRNLEPGEKPINRREHDTSGIEKEVIRNHQRRMRIEI